MRIVQGFVLATLFAMPTALLADDELDCGGPCVEIIVDCPTGQIPGYLPQSCVDDPNYRPPTTTSVPEPGTLALLGLGLTGLALRRRRKAD